MSRIATHSMIRMFAAGQPNLGGAVMGSNAVQPSADFQRNALLLEELGDEMHRPINRLL